MSPPEPILVVGDSMLDRYWEGAVDRISPEAPVPILRMGREWECAGGAANVAVNLAALRCSTTLVTLLGKDEAGDRLAALLLRSGVELQAVRSPDVATTQKIRAVCRRQQLLRIDIEQPVPAQVHLALGDLVGDLLPRHPWVLLSDYAKGSLQDCPAILRRADARGARVLVDPKGDDFGRYRGAWLLKPNEAEATRIAGAGSDAADFDARMASLQRSLEVRHLLVTRGERGMSLYSADRAPLHIAAETREVYDVSGAGDTVLAALASALAGGASLDDAVRLANRAAGIVVGKFGTATVTPEELSATVVAAQAA